MTQVAERPRAKRKRPPSRTTSDPVTAYARAVLDGTVLAGRAVKLTARRHLRDLDRQRTPEFPYRFDAAAAEHIIQFYAEFLTLEDGRPFLLTPWQAFCLGSIFGWKRVSDGGRRFQTAYIETGKGSGKSPLLAGAGLYGLAFDSEHAAEIYSAAFDREQASIILNDAIRMASASLDLAEILTIGKYNIADERTGSFFRAVSSEHRSKSGPRPHFVLIDELHEHRDGTVVNKMRAGFKGRLQPLLLAITNSGVDRTSICWVYHQHSLSVLEGTIVDEQWFSYVCQLDPCQPHFEEGYRQPKDGCSACDDWTNPAVWGKVNPSIGVTIQLPYLQTQVDLAIAMPSERGLVMRLNFCLWTESHQVWIPSDRWDACKVEQVHDSNPELLPCAAGLDPSTVHDLTALCVALRIDDPPSAGPAEDVEIEGLDEAGARVKVAYTLNFSVEVIPYFWLPEETLLERVQKERLPLDVWKRDKHLFSTPGPVIDHQAVYDFTLGVMKQFKVQRLGMDENYGRLLFVMLRDQGRLGDKIVSVGQAKKLSEAYKLIMALVRTRRLRHNGHPVLAWNVANAEPQTDRLGATWIERPKHSEAKRIDGAVAMAMAIHQLMVLPAKRPGLQIHFLGGRS